MAASRRALVDFLIARAVDKDHTLSHTAMGQGFGPGRFYVTTPDHEHLYRLYTAAICDPAASPIALVERHRHDDPVVIDLDLRFTPQPSDPCDRIVDPHRIHLFVTSLFHEMYRILQVPVEARVYVLEKPPRPTKPGSTIFKDGLHVVVPDVVTSPYIQFALRDAMLPHVRRIFGDHPSLSGAFDPAVVYDEAVILKNGWLMTGSKKPDEPHPWTLTRVYQRVGSDTTLCTGPLPPLSQQVTLLSIRNKFLRTPCTDLGVERSLMWEIEEDLAHERRAAAAAAAAAAADMGTEAPSVPLDEVAGLVDILGDARSVKHDPWFSMCRLLVNVTGGSQEGRDLFHAFSGRAGEGKYDAAACDALWARLRTSPPADGRRLGMGTLVMWAREDDLDAYVAWQASRRRSSRTPADETTAAAALASTTDSALDTAAISQRLLDMGWNDDAGECVVVRDRTSKTIRVSSGSARASVCTDTFATTVWDEANGQPPRFIGSFVETANVPGADVSRLHKDLPSDTTYTYQRQSADRASLLSGAPHNTEVELLNPFTSTVHTRIRAVGAVARSVTNKGKVAMLQDAVRQALGNVGNIQYGIVNNILAIHTGSGAINIGGTGAPSNSDFAALRVDLVDHARDQRMKKYGGSVYKPVEGCPCAYELYADFAEYVNEVLGEDERLLASTRNFKELVTYMELYDQRDFPKLRRDLDLLSFSNGVLELSSSTFTAYDSMDPDAPLASQVARHHIPFPYTDCPDTPLIDCILGAQFDGDVAELLCALFGRTLFKVGQKDNWQVMPYLVGIGGTGKSLLLKVLESLFAPTSVGNLASKREEIFGLANLVTKEVVLGRDMPAKLSGCLPQEVMQAMTAGEGMEVARKNLEALNVAWTAPVVMASNHMPDYVNTGNNVGRRIVTFRFDKVVSAPREGLQEEILAIELPNLVCRCLRAYEEARTKVDSVGGSFWKAVPPTILEWQSRLASSTNKLHEFLSMEDDERGCRIVREEGHVTWLHDLKAAFEIKMGHATFVSDPTVCHSFGFSISEKLENVCKSCKQVAKGRGVKCCTSYDASNRTKKFVVFNMRLTTGSISGGI